MLVDSNLHREHILPSEKAFAYKMKYDAIKHQALRLNLRRSERAMKFSEPTVVRAVRKYSVISA